jgi:hypothetical protein
MHFNTEDTNIKVSSDAAIAQKNLLPIKASMSKNETLSIQHQLLWGNLLSIKPRTR